MSELTKKQDQAFNFIRRTIEVENSSPTLRELCDFMGYRSIGSAQDMVAILRRKEFLTNPSAQRARGFVMTEKGRWYDRSPEEVEESSDAYMIPCLGSVPAGLPLEAVEESIGNVTVDRSLVGPSRGKNLFALKAEGESMIDAGILDGDWLVVEAVEEATQEDIVVARIGADATVKRLARDKNGWFLKPENKDFKPIYAHDQAFEVVGKVVALQRSL